MTLVAPVTFSHFSITEPKLLSRKPSIILRQMCPTLGVEILFEGELTFFHESLLSFDDVYVVELFVYFRVLFLMDH